MRARLGSFSFLTLTRVTPSGLVAVWAGSPLFLHRFNRSTVRAVNDPELVLR